MGNELQGRKVSYFCVFFQLKHRAVLYAKCGKGLQCSKATNLPNIEVYVRLYCIKYSTNKGTFFFGLIS